MGKRLTFDALVEESVALIVAGSPFVVSPNYIHDILRSKAKECGEMFDMEVAYEQVCVQLESEEIDVE